MGAEPRHAADGLRPRLIPGVRQGIMTRRFRRSPARSSPAQESKRGPSETIVSYAWCAILLTFVVAQGCSMSTARDFTVAGEKANALLCRPEGKGPFPVLVWSHGRVTDPGFVER